MKTWGVFLAGLLTGGLALWLLLGDRLLPGESLPDPPPQAQAIESVEFGDVTAPGPAPVEIPPPEPLPPDPLPLPPPLPMPELEPMPMPEPEPAANAAPAATPVSALPVPTRRLDLLLPVQGITATQLSDTFTDARSEGRGHDAIDIMAPTGTPVLAVEDGRIVKFFDSERGGLTIYQFDAHDELAYYYAHLDRRAKGLAEGQAVKRGDVIGYVGYSGNASPEAPHLHFAIFVLGPEKNWWQGTAINPYEYLGGRAR